MNKEAPDIGTGPNAGGTGQGARALVVAGAEDAWLLPDDPFLNAGCRPIRASNIDEAHRLYAAHRPDIVFLTVALNGAPALSCIEKCLAGNPAARIVVVARNDQINEAARAMRAGATDCLFTPFSHARLTGMIERFIGTGADIAPDQPGRDTGPPSHPGTAYGMIGNDGSMLALFRAIDAVARSRATVFLHGEHGTGKELCARAIHAKSDRAGAPFHLVNCAALTASSLDAQLPESGTLYLDEICDLDLLVQGRLLRLLQGRDGPGAPEPADRRILCATRRDPAGAMRDGKLREDLFYRLYVAPLHLPPLRDRGDDVLDIARAKLAEFCAEEGASFTGFSAGACDLIRAYPWPGNVRQLLNVVWNIVLMHEGPVVSAGMLPADLQTAKAGGTAADGQTPQPLADLSPGGLIGRPLVEIERQVIEATIRAEGGSLPRAARVLGVSPSTLYRKRDAWTGKPKPGD